MINYVIDLHIYYVFSARLLKQFLPRSTTRELVILEILNHELDHQQGDLDLLVLITIQLISHTYMGLKPITLLLFESK